MGASEGEGPAAQQAPKRVVMARHSAAGCHRARGGQLAPWAGAHPRPESGTAAFFNLLQSLVLPQPDTHLVMPIF